MTVLPHFSQRDTPTVVFPIETTIRELDSKVATASALAKLGLRCVVAHKEAAWWIGNASRRILWVGKNLFSDQSTEHHADRLLANDSAVFFLQDEGGIFQVDTWVDNVLQKQHVDLVRARNLDRVFMWGSRQKKVVDQRSPETAESVVVTGTPRFDLCLDRFAWMSEDAHRSVSSQYGPFILACTRFTAVAHEAGLADPFRRKLNPLIWPDGYDSQKLASLWFSKWRRDVRDFADFVFLLKTIAFEFPERKIVLRPHPSESMDFYTRAFVTIPNVVVVREGNVLDWIRAADLVLHSDCTTGIEAVIAGRPTVNFLPTDAPRGDTDIEVAREAGLSVGTFEDAVDAVSASLAGRPSSHVWSPHAAGILNNLIEPSIPLVSREVLAVLKNRAFDSSELVLPPKRPAREYVKRMIGRTRLYSDSYIAGKRGRLDLGYLERLVAGCKTNGLGAGRIVDFAPKYVVIDPE